MLQFLNIIFLNAWRGMRRANVLPALVLMLASLSVLLVGSNAAASGSVHDAAHVITHAADTVRQMTFGSANSTNPGTPVANGKQPKPKKQPSTADTQPTTNSTNAQQNPATATQPTQATSQSSTVQLSATEPTCQQGQIAYTVNSASYSLAAPTTADGTLTYYWEMRIDSGTNNSGTPPISSAQTSQDLPAGSSQVTLSGSQSQPLVSAPASINYAYSFRLHVLVGSTDTTSAWVSIPQATSTTCSQS